MPFLLRLSTQFLKTTLHFFKVDSLVLSDEQELTNQCHIHLTTELKTLTEK
jgi:hypothetical protein